MRRQIWYFIDHICRHLSKLCICYYNCNYNPYIATRTCQFFLHRLQYAFGKEFHLGTTDQRYLAFEDSNTVDQLSILSFLTSILFSHIPTQLPATYTILYVEVTRSGVSHFSIILSIVYLCLSQNTRGLPNNFISNYIKWPINVNQYKKT